MCGVGWGCAWVDEEWKLEEMRDVDRVDSDEEIGGWGGVKGSGKGGLNERGEGEEAGSARGCRGRLDRDGQGG